MSRGAAKKGAAGERELCTVLQGYGFDTERGGVSYGTVPDVIGLPGIHVECKRQEKLNVPEAMRQAVRDAERFQDGMPAVFHRRNRQPWLVTVRLDDFMRMYQAAAESSAVTSCGAGEYKNTSDG